MAYDVYEVTIELENGDWPYMQVDADLYDYHRAVIVGLDFAYQRRGKLVSVNKIGIARDADDKPTPGLETYTMQVQTALVRAGENSGLDTADTAVVVVGSIKRVGPGDCAAQIIANRHDAAGTI